MANQWFKFYGGEYLSDTKMLRLNGNERSCWITLLSLASQTKDGVVKYITEDQLLQMSGVSEKLPILKKFEELEMISICNGDVTILNWVKRQLSESVIRVRNYRMKQKGNGNVTTEENRREENREERGEKITPKTISQKFFNFSEVELNDFIDRLAKSTGLDPGKARTEVLKFRSYWKEKNKSGTKEKWEMQDTFEVQRRLSTWLQNDQKWSSGRKGKSVDEAISNSIL